MASKSLSDYDYLDNIPFEERCKIVRGLFNEFVRQNRLRKLRAVGVVAVEFSEN